jgi:hypothetical protein
MAVHYVTARIETEGFSLHPLLSVKRRHKLAVLLYRKDFYFVDRFHDSALHGADALATARRIRRRWLLSFSVNTPSVLGKVA